MRIAVTGKSGQVVSCLRERGPLAGHEIVAIGRPELDLLDPHSVLREVIAAKPDAVVSAAAFTQVDLAESEREQTFALNAAGAEAVARAANQLNVPLIHLSTDYVFDGTATQPYREDDPVAPLGVYGESKLAGEQAVLSAHPGNSAVLRTAWVYSPFGTNFVKTMLRLAADREEIGVVADQIGNPSSALDLADGILAVAANLAADSDPARRGIFHLSASGTASWADFAEAIFTMSKGIGGPSAQVRRIASAQYPTPAARPANSRLDCSKIARIHGVVLPDWHDALDAVLKRLLPPS